LPDDPFTRGKCGFKILQYFAAGLPVVASPIGYNTELVIPETTGLWAFSQAEWLTALKRLIEDQSLWEQMSRQGRHIAVQHDVEALGARFCDLIHRSR
jgi:glycosyltransferase involved in cell wall biosynthesis